MSTIPPNFDNFFALFDQPVAFEVDADALDKRLRELQQQYHPDRLNSEPDLADAKSDLAKPNDANLNNTTSHNQKNSALINHAYHILRYPDSRANYLLELSGQEMNLNDSISDLDFLDNAMDLRIRLDDAVNPSALQTLKSELTPQINEQSLRFSSAFNRKQWSDAIDATQKLRFLMKIQKDINDAVDKLHQPSDDDFYL